MNAPDKGLAAAYAHRTDGRGNDCRLPVSDHFPPSVRDALVRASQTPFDEMDPLARVRAINKAIQRARLAYPELFRPDEVTQ
jgi:hypothetical protein